MILKKIKSLLIAINAALILATSAIQLIYCSENTNQASAKPTEMRDASSSIDQLFDPTEEPCDERPLAGEICLSAASILSLITVDPEDPAFVPVINVPAILKENLYKRTIGPVARRPLVDEPTLQMYCFDNDYISFTIQPFYNYTPKVFFTEHSPYIKDYIDLTNKNIINELSTAQFKIKELLNNPEAIDINIPGLLGLFEHLKLQQHRVGVMLGFCRQYPRFNLSYRIPLYYLVEHFFLTEEEIERIENNKFFTVDESLLGITKKDRVEQFAHQHLVSDRIGFGDSRLIALANFYENCNSELWVGVQLTIPTAKKFKRGILGGKFNNCAAAPPLNIKQLFNLAFCPENGTIEQMQAQIVIQQELFAFLIGALDRLSTILINAPLGNGKHWGIGPEVDFRYQFNDYWSMHSYGVIEAFSSHKERRFFLVKKNPADFKRNFRDEEMSEQNLAFLNTQIINTLYPQGVSIQIKPGPIVKLRQSFMYDTPHFHGLFGFDFWAQGKEHFGDFKLDCDPCGPLALNKGRHGAAYQGKLFGEIGYYGTAFYHCITWHALFTLDATIFNQGIGKSFTVGIRVGIDF